VSHKRKKTIMWQETALYSYHYVKDLADSKAVNLMMGRGTEPIWDTKEQTLTS